MTFSFSCSRCTGRGWTLADPDPWPVACSRCEGSGTFTVRRLAKLLDVDHRTIASVATLRARLGCDDRRDGLRVVCLEQSTGGAMVDLGRMTKSRTEIELDAAYARGLADGKAAPRTCEKCAAPLITMPDRCVKHPRSDERGKF